ncbi:MAG: type IV toxin-antitoxin system AbiEi family antitoxin domain-containing protein [Candidatus Izemoplasmataceae bacterium]
MIMKLANENNGIITSQMLKDREIPSVYLTRMVKEGNLQRIDRGIYSTEEVILDEYYLLYQKNQRAIFSFSSALYLHGLTDRIPYQMEITLPSSYNSSHINEDVIIHKVVEKYYGLGRIIKTTMFGNAVACYDMERTICDLVRFRDKIDVEIFKKALIGYKKHPERDYQKLRQYAKIMRISKRINDLLDVI